MAVVDSFSGLFLPPRLLFLYFYSSAGLCVLVSLSPLPLSSFRPSFLRYPSFLSFVCLFDFSFFHSSQFSFIYPRFPAFPRLMPPFPAAALQGA
jgi:hypothetical protein